MARCGLARIGIRVVGLEGGNAGEGSRGPNRLARDRISRTNSVSNSSGANRSSVLRMFVDIPLAHSEHTVVAGRIHHLRQIDDDRPVFVHRSCVPERTM